MTSPRPRANDGDQDPADLAFRRELARAQAILDRHGHGFAVAGVEFVGAPLTLGPLALAGLGGHFRGTDLWTASGRRIFGLLVAVDEVGVRMALERLHLACQGVPATQGTPWVQAHLVARSGESADALMRRLRTRLTDAAAVVV